MSKKNEQFTWSNYIANAESEEDKRILREQCEDSVQSDRPNLVDCADCKDTFMLQLLFRCLYCGKYFCGPCAEKHFGEELHKWRLKKNPPAS